MSTIVNKVFGQLTYDHLWQGESSVVWNNNTVRVKIMVSSTEDQTPNEAQENNYTYLKENLEVVLANSVDKLLEFCKSTYDSHLKREELIVRVLPKEFLFRRNGKWGIIFSCPWENEMNLAVVFRGDAVIAGLDDLLI